MGQPRGNYRDGFVRELLFGFDALSATQRKSLSTEIVDLVRARGFPLHVANLWNALYFEFDLNVGAYDPDVMRKERVPLRTMHQRAKALPVGAFVRVQTGSGEIWSEVVYKEGRCEEITSDSVPPETSGAPPIEVFDGRERKARRREVLIFDYHAFEAVRNQRSLTDHARLLRKERWLDAFGHLIVEAVYPFDNQEPDDATSYARYLFDEHRDGLTKLTRFLNAEATDDDVWTCLLQSFRNVADLALNCPDLGCWRNYFFLRADYDRRVSDAGRDTILGSDDLHRVFKNLVAASVRDSTSYTAIGPNILDLLRQQDLNDNERQFLIGPKYVETVCYTNAFVRDRIARESTQGLLPNGRHLRLDDAFTFGGVWRSETPSSGSEWFINLPPEMALGLGYASTRVNDEPRTPEDEPLTIESSQFGWRVALTPTDLDEGWLRLSATALNAIKGEDRVGWKLDHNGFSGVRREAILDREQSLLRGVLWPGDMVPGIFVNCAVELGGSTIRMKTARLPETVWLNDHKLEYDFSESVARRACGQIPHTFMTKATSLADLIHVVFRNRGRHLENGGRVLATIEVVNAILGLNHSTDASRAVRLALQSLQLEFRNGQHVWYPRVTRRTRVQDRALLAAYGEVSKERVRGIVNRHVVPMHLRRLHAGEQSSVEKRCNYARALEKSGLIGIRAPELPDGFTWVESHFRGQRREERGSQASI